jgi:hypothetical protein
MLVNKPRFLFLDGSVRKIRTGNTLRAMKGEHAGGLRSLRVRYHCCLRPFRLVARAGAISDPPGDRVPRRGVRARDHYALRRLGRMFQTAEAGRLTVAPSLSVAMVSSVM